MDKWYAFIETSKDGLQSGRLMTPQLSRYIGFTQSPSGEMNSCERLDVVRATDYDALAVELAKLKLRNEGAPSQATKGANLCFHFPNGLKWEKDMTREDLLYIIEFLVTERKQRLRDIEEGIRMRWPK